MKIFKYTSSLKMLFAFLTLVLSSMVSYAGNPVDSDLSNRAGTNSGNSHLDIYIFIVALLVLCIIVPFFEKKRSRPAN